MAIMWAGETLEEARKRINNDTEADVLLHDIRPDNTIFMRERSRLIDDEAEERLL